MWYIVIETHSVDKSYEPRYWGPFPGYENARRWKIMQDLKPHQIKVFTIAQLGKVE